VSPQLALNYAIFDDFLMQFSVKEFRSKFDFPIFIGLTPIQKTGQTWSNDFGGNEDRLKTLREREKNRDRKLNS
jgi:hypothetical protein